MTRHTCAATVGFAAGTLFLSQARAAITYDPCAKIDYELCRDKFNAKPELSSLLSELETKPGYSVHITCTDGMTGTPAKNKYKATDGFGPSDSTVEWNLAGTDVYQIGYNCPGHENTAPPYYVSEDKCATLYHELYHAHLQSVGQDIWNKDCNSEFALNIREAEATKAENRYRKAYDLCTRDYYKPMGSGPQKVPPEEVNCDKYRIRLVLSPTMVSIWGEYWVSVMVLGGDPHLISIDGARYDFHAVGEFVMARSTEDNLEIQARLAPPWPGQEYTTAVSAVAANVGGAIVELSADDWAMYGTLRVAGAVTPAPIGGMTLTGGGIVAANSDRSFDIYWPDRSHLYVRPLGAWGLDVKFSPNTARAGKLEGLGGNFDGIAGNDVRVRGGAQLPYPPSNSDLYPVFANSWRVSGSACTTALAPSLFSYESGVSSATFTDCSAPAYSPPVAPAAATQTAQSVCQQAGVTSTEGLDYCTHDVALTGLAEFASGTAATEATLPLRVTVPAGGVKTVSFFGTKDAPLFIDVPKVAFSTGRVDVYDMTSGLTIPYAGAGTTADAFGGGPWTATDVVSGGKAFWETRRLPSTGAYELRFVNYSGAVGDAYFRMYEPALQAKSIVVDGSPADAIVATPGALSALTFNGTMGDVLRIDGTSTLSEKMGVFRLVKSDWTSAKDGWSGNVRADGVAVFNNGGSSSLSFSLPYTGSYTILLDPEGHDVGKITLTVHH